MDYVNDTYDKIPTTRKEKTLVEADKDDSEERDWKVSDFEIGKPLGEGRFGHVYLARTKKEHYIIALKVLHKKQIIDEHMELQLNREVEIQGRLSHPNILKMHNFFWDDTKFYLILQYASNGELFRHLRKRGHYTESEAATVSLILVILRENHK